MTRALAVSWKELGKGWVEGGTRGRNEERRCGGMLYSFANGCDAAYTASERLKPPTFPSEGKAFGDCIKRLLLEESSAVGGGEV